MECILAVQMVLLFLPVYRNVMYPSECKSALLERGMCACSANGAPLSAQHRLAPVDQPLRLQHLRQHHADLPRRTDPDAQVADGHHHPGGLGVPAARYVRHPQGAPEGEAVLLPALEDPRRRHRHLHSDIDRPLLVQVQYVMPGPDARRMSMLVLHIGCELHSACNKPRVSFPLDTLLFY